MYILARTLLAYELDMTPERVWCVSQHHVTCNNVDDEKMLLLT